MMLWNNLDGFTLSYEATAVGSMSDLTQWHLKVNNDKCNWVYSVVNSNDVMEQPWWFTLNYEVTAVESRSVRGGKTIRFEDVQSLLIDFVLWLIAVILVILHQAMVETASGVLGSFFILFIVYYFNCFTNVLAG